jgi:hypothetical protein
MSSEPLPPPITQSSLNRKKLFPHAVALGFSIPLCLAFANIVTSGLNDIWPIAVLLIGVILTLPWSAFALVLYFLAIDGHLYEPLDQALPYLMAAIMVPGAYFNGYQFGGFLEGAWKRHFRTRDIA